MTHRLLLFSFLMLLVQLAPVHAADSPKPAFEPSAALMQRILKAADKTNDGKLSLEEYKPLDVQAKHHGEEHFKAGDKNSDGLIDATELADSLNKQTWFAILSEDTQACFTRLDATQDAKLDASEYRKISRMGAHAEQHFKGADTDKNGFLDITEFTAHAEHKLTMLESGLERRLPNVHGHVVKDVLALHCHLSHRIP